MSDISELFQNNRRWAARQTAVDPDYFNRLSLQQAPKYLWIGCSDSRVSADAIVGLMPGEVFVHRNIANLVVHTDLNCLSVIQFAVEVLKVEHIIVCGHYGCGGIRAAIDGREHGLIDNWLHNIQDIYRYHKDQMGSLPDHESRVHLLCELNVFEQVANVCQTTIVQSAWRAGQTLSVHGVVYSIGDGILKQLGTPINDTMDLSPTYRFLYRNEGRPG